LRDALSARFSALFFGSHVLTTTDGVTAQMNISIPRTPDGLDTAWFRQALALAQPGVEVAQVRLVQDIPGTSSKLRFHVDYAPGRDGGLPPTILVKGGFAPHSDMFLSMHLTEMRYYRDIAPNAVLDTPACYFAGEDAATGRSVVLLEDITLRKVRWLSALEGLDWHDVARFVDVLASFAAQYWASPELEPGGRLEWVIDSYSAEAKAYMDHYLDPARWDDFMHRPRCACLPRRLRDRDRMCAVLGHLARRLGTQGLTLSHGDTHLGNLYVNRDSTPGYLDAQPRRAPWVKDFAYHVAVALDIDDRRAWERPLLARYLRRLTEAGLAEIPSFEEAWHDYGCELNYGLFIFMINESHFQHEEINTAYTARFGAAVMDHDTLRI
jgi:hypothetical protein